MLCYLIAENPAIAKKFKSIVQDKLSRLEFFPESGRRLLEFPDLEYREVIVDSYRFFYRVDNNRVLIVAVWHGAQDVKPPSD
jgi:plasmid stabilization system protein ParE